MGCSLSDIYYRVKYALQLLLLLGSGLLKPLMIKLIRRKSTFTILIACRRFITASEHVYIRLDESSSELQFFAIPAAAALKLA